MPWNSFRKSSFRLRPSRTRPNNRLCTGKSLRDTVNVAVVRYLVRAQLKAGCEQSLLNAIECETLGRGSVAEGEYLRNMADARISNDNIARWVEVCYCPTPLAEERPYWEEYFELTMIQDAHDRRRCKDRNGTQPWACDRCDCTERLERKLAQSGESFLDKLRRESGSSRKSSGADR